MNKSLVIVLIVTVNQSCFCILVAHITYSLPNYIIITIYYCWWNSKIYRQKTRIQALLSSFIVYWDSYLCFPCLDSIFKRHWKHLFLNDVNWTMSFCLISIISSSFSKFFTTLFKTDDFSNYVSSIDLPTEIQLRFQNPCWNLCLNGDKHLEYTFSKIQQIVLSVKHWIISLYSQLLFN